MTNTTKILNLLNSLTPNEIALICQVALELTDIALDPNISLEQLFTDATREIVHIDLDD
jgi:hypothetical protein